MLKKTCHIVGEWKNQMNNAYSEWLSRNACIKGTFWKALA